LRDGGAPEVDATRIEMSLQRWNDYNVAAAMLETCW
jgi:hypothetical protein